MGCAASKAAAEELITCTPPPAQVETPVIKQKEPTVTKVDNKLVQVLAAAAPCAQIAPSAEAIIPKQEEKREHRVQVRQIRAEGEDITIRQKHAGISFEIPLDLPKKINKRQASVPPFLPKLGLARQDIHYPSTEARWKADEQLEMMYSIRQVSSVDLRQRLLEKEAQAASNREKEKKRLLEKIARQEEHARLVLERKRAIGSRQAAGFRSSKNIAEATDSGYSSRSGSGRTVGETIV